jgi:sec-independent protein translocase protein TatB|tara:strand:- start:334 stop:546 length:213 start_codon:yes stop_codon:yes gene_type:complete
MPQIGWFELLIIIIVAILVIGPKDFPIVLNKVGSWIGSIKSYFSDVQKNMNEITNLEEDNKKDKSDEQKK